MKTIQFQVTDAEYDQACLIVRELYACCPGFDVSSMAKVAHELWCEDMMRKVAAKRQNEDTSHAFGISEAAWRDLAKHLATPKHLRKEAVNVVSGPWKGGKVEA